MAGITKNFIIKNGLEVNGNLLVVSTDKNKVGVGTTVLSHDFNVKGGIGVTNVVVTGITTVNEFQSTYSQLGIATASYYRVGTTTVFETSGGLVSLSGIQTADSTTRTTLTNVLLAGQVNINNLNITGFATFSNGSEFSKNISVAGLTTTNFLYVVGVSTFVGIATYQNTLFGTQLNVSGVSTLSSAIVGSAVTITSGGINVTGVSTIRNINSTQLTSTNINVSGVSTLSSAIVGSGVTITSGGINVTGIVTATGFFGSGANLIGVIAAANLGISTAGGFVGSGVTLLNFRGSGISTVFTNFTSGISTIFIEGGTVTPGGINTQVQFNNSGVLGGSANFTFDGTGATIGTSRFNGSGINAGIITATSFSGSGSGITGLTNTNLSGSAGITNANLANYTISGISLGGTLATLTLATSGTGLSGSASYTGASGQTFTVTSNAASANTASTIVARDAGGGFVAGIVTAGTFSGNVVGNISASGISTLSSVIVGSATTITGGGVNAVGVVTATSHDTKGSGSYKIGGTDVITSTREVQKVILSSYSEKLYAFGNTSTAPTLDISNGNFVTATLTGNATFAFSLGTGVSSDAISFTLHLSNDATPNRTITWPAAVVWPNGTVPTRTTEANKTDVYTFYTYSGGSTWYGNLSIYNYS